MISKLKCPKCKGKDLVIIEHWYCGITFYQEEGVIDSSQGIIEPDNAYKLVSTCLKCNHKWTVKGAIQITNLSI